MNNKLLLYISSGVESLHPSSLLPFVGNVYSSTCFTTSARLPSSTSFSRNIYPFPIMMSFQPTVCPAFVQAPSTYDLDLDTYVSIQAARQAERRAIEREQRAAAIQRAMIQQAIVTEAERQEAHLRHVELHRQAELCRQAEIRRQAHLRQQAQLRRQAELRLQAELRRQVALRQQAVLIRRRQVQLALERRLAQMAQRPMTWTINFESSEDQDSHIKQPVRSVVDTRSVCSKDSRVSCYATGQRYTLARASRSTYVVD